MGRERVGVVVKFDPARGFGFIRPGGSGDDVFVHIGDVVGRSLLRCGQQVTFVEEETPKGPMARRVQPGGMEPSPTGIYLFRAALTFASMAATARFGLGLPTWLAMFLAINATTFVFYGYDKSAAGRGSLRVPERILHLLALVGGSLGGLFGQGIFRHKTRKWSFLWVYWAIVAFQVAALCGVAWCDLERPAWVPGPLRALFYQPNRWSR